VSRHSEQSIRHLNDDKHKEKERVLEATHGEAVGTIVVVLRVEVIRIEVQVVSVITVRRRRPVVGVRSLIVQRPRLTIAVTS
jgi:hypothetical protein